MTGHHHHSAPRVRTEEVVLDIGDDLGGLVFYARSDLRGHEIEVLAQTGDAHKIHCEVDERIVNGRTIFTGVFPPVPAGEYQVCRPESRAGERFTVTAGHVQEIDWSHSQSHVNAGLLRTLVGAMKASGAPTRVISVSTGSMGPGDAAMGIGLRLVLGFFRTFVARNLGVVGRDLAVMEHELAVMEHELAASELDWYAVRPAKLRDGPLTKRVQASERFAMKAISRADVAWNMLSLAEDPRPLHWTPMRVSARAALSSEVPQLAGSASETRKVAAR